MRHHFFLSFSQTYTKHMHHCRMGGAYSHVMSQAPTELATACRQQDVDRVQQLLAQRADVNAVGQYELRMQPLHYAAMSGNTAVLQLLIDNKAELESCNSNQWTALHIAAHNADDDAVNTLLNNGAQIDTCNASQIAALHRALLAKHERTARLLIDRRANVDAVTYDGSTPLGLAISLREPLHIVELLLESKADVALASSNGKLLHDALMGYSGKSINTVVRLLLMHRVDVNQRYNNDATGATPLHYATFNNRVSHETLLELLNAKAHLDAKDRTGQTPLHKAVIAQAPDQFISSLIEYGANIHVLNVCRALRGEAAAYWLTDCPSVWCVLRRIWDHRHWSLHIRHTPRT
jgi:ankyrin repeat protein